MLWQTAWLAGLCRDLAKHPVVNHHPPTTRFVVVESNEAAVAVFRVEIGPIVRQDVRVQVDLHLK